MSWQYLFKYIIIGETGAGKQEILWAITEQHPRADDNLTFDLGVEFGTRLLTINDEKIKLQIWDTAGSESFRSITKSYYKGAVCALIVYDVARRDGLARVKSWLEEARANMNKHALLHLIGTSFNKSREISYEEGAEFARQHKLDFIEVTQESLHLLDDVILRIARRIYDAIQGEEFEVADESSGVKVGTGIAGTRKGSGLAWPAAALDNRIVNQVDWYVTPVSGIAGNLGIMHSLLKIRVVGDNGAAIYALEKAALPDEISPQDAERFENGVFVSDWRDVAPSLKSGSIRTLRRNQSPASNASASYVGDLNSEQHTIGSLRRLFVELGPYEVSTCNCHQAAFQAYNACASCKLRESDMPNYYASYFAGALQTFGINIGYSECATSAALGVGVGVGAGVSCSAGAPAAVAVGASASTAGTIGISKAAGMPRSSWKPVKKERDSAWMKKAQELGNRGVQLGKLLEFFAKLGTPALMPHFDPKNSTTSDVVRQAIIPSSWSGNLDQDGEALSSVLEGGPILATRLVSHTWTNLFANTLAAMVADVLNEPSYEQILPRLTPVMLPGLVEELKASDKLSTVFWFCAFSVNQHDNICGGFGPAPPEGSAEFNEWDSKRRDSITGQIYPLCQCQTEKHFNDAGATCEINKFDDMMDCMYEQCKQRGMPFCLVVAVDPEFVLFKRIWCMAELAESSRLGIKVEIKMPKRHLNEIDNQLMRNIRIQDCQATRQADVDEVLEKIGGQSQVEEFNKFLQIVLFGDGDKHETGNFSGLIRNWMHEVAKSSDASRRPRNAKLRSPTEIPATTSSASMGGRLTSMGSSARTISLVASESCTLPSL